MRKLLTTAALLLITAGIACAQRHLEFRGIPIAGDITRFSEEMEQQGFVLSSSNGDSYFFEGMDERLQDVFTAVTCLPEKGDVYGVMMASAAQLTFYSAETLYKREQKFLDKEYGEGYYDERIDPEYDDDDLSRMLAISNGKGRYYSEYTLPNGTVTLSMISRSGILYVAVGFVDKEGGKAMEKNL